MVYLFDGALSLTRASQMCCYHGSLMGVAIPYNIFSFLKIMPEPQAMANVKFQQDWSLFCYLLFTALVEYGPRRKRTMLNAAHILLQNPRTDVDLHCFHAY